MNADEFLAVSRDFTLGGLVTEASHPKTRNLSDAAKRSVPEALGLLFDVDSDVLTAYRRWMSTDAPTRIARTVSRALDAGRRVFITGCGATGRLAILLESEWRRRHGGDSVVSIMAGGDYALVKSVEGFEDFAAFGERQLRDAGVGPGDVVFAVTEGGETSFVIGTAWEGLRAGASVYFVYCNPDETLMPIARSREVLAEPRIEKVNLTTGPMAVMGSTRMQATSVQLLALGTVLGFPTDGLEEAHAALCSPEVREALAEIVRAEADTYARGARSTYFADRLAVDVLTDTTERSPTFCTPAFRKWDDASADDSWTYLILPRSDWAGMLGRPPRCVAWSEAEIAEMIGAERAARQAEIVRQIGVPELLRFRIGADGLEHRPVRQGDLAVSVACEGEDFFRERPGRLIYFGESEQADVRVPAREGLATRMAAKMLLNALSTCVMTLLGRVMGNCMVAVVPSNLKLIDRSTRYVQTLTGLSYEESCRLLFAAIDEVRPLMQAGRSYTPPVELAVAMHRGLPRS
ncbi:MAG: hypothetical protein ACYC2Y_07790 [Armatimonadota bacterium]